MATAILKQHRKATAKAEKLDAFGQTKAESESATRAIARILGMPVSEARKDLARYQVKKLGEDKLTPLRNEIIGLYDQADVQLGKASAITSFVMHVEALSDQIPDNAAEFALWAVRDLMEGAKKDLDKMREISVKHLQALIEEQPAK